MPARKKIEPIDIGGLLELVENSFLIQCAADKHTFLFMIGNILRDFYDPKKIQDVLEHFDLHWKPLKRRDKKLYTHFLAFIKTVPPTEG
jgi:hypothetical protein